LEPSKPESLVYYKNPNNESEKLLAGFMFLVDSLEAEGEQVAGPLTVWHYHSTPSTGQGGTVCFNSTISRGRGFESIDCSDNDLRKYRGPEMLHIWFIKHPEGPFATRMGIPSEYLKSPEKMSKKEFKRYTEKSYRNLTEAE
jgi:hypothetical protein